jgi:hypothetical protein
MIQHHVDIFHDLHVFYIHMHAVLRGLPQLAAFTIP